MINMRGAQLRNQWKSIFLVLLMLLIFQQGSAEEADRQNVQHFKISSTVNDVITHPTFSSFGRFILPLEWGYDPEVQLSRVGSLLPYHSHVNADEVVETLNYILEAVAVGQITFYDIYTDAQKQADPAKENTGLFFFKGEPDMPFAVVSAGGGFSYVGSIHESFPHAIALSEQGYNTFTVQYRTGGADVACEDLAAALTFIFSNADELKIKTSNYSLWGGSAGARMAAYLGSYGPAAYGGNDLPRPATIVMQYTGHSDYTADDPPTFAVIGSNDGIASPTVMERRVNTLQSMGIDAEFHLYQDVSHGFGLGTGTPAEGWIEDAIAFWEKHMQ